MISLTEGIWGCFVERAFSLMLMEPSEMDPMVGRKLVQTLKRPIC